jgi:hypothetical protein
MRRSRTGSNPLDWLTDEPLVVVTRVPASTIMSTSGQFDSMPISFTI